MTSANARRASSYAPSSLGCSGGSLGEYSAEVRPGHRAFGLRLADAPELGRNEPRPDLKRTLSRSVRKSLRIAEALIRWSRE